jgi:hypothetical protein
MYNIIGVFFPLFFLSFGVGNILVSSFLAAFGYVVSFFSPLSLNFPLSVLCMDLKS